MGGAGSWPLVPSFTQVRYLALLPPLYTIIKLFMHLLINFNSLNALKNAYKNIVNYAKDVILHKNSTQTLFLQAEEGGS